MIDLKQVYLRGEGELFIELGTIHLVTFYAYYTVPNRNEFLLYLWYNPRYDPTRIARE